MSPIRRTRQSVITRINLPERPCGHALGNGFAFVADGGATCKS
jgi:hypothetical protein